MVQVRPRQFQLRHPGDDAGEARDVGPTLLPGIPLQYDPMPVLRNLATPQLWILGEDDIDAPSAETARRLEQLAAVRPIRVAVFPHAGHGIYDHETAPDGTRLSTCQPDGYFQMMRDFIVEGRIGPAYGTARIDDPRRPWFFEIDLHSPARAHRIAVVRTCRIPVAGPAGAESGGQA